MLNPVFSTKHMKNMIPLFYRITHKVCNAITENVEEQPQELNVLSWISRTALELIGVAGLGYSFESFDKEKSPSEYAQAVKELAYVATLFVSFPLLLLISSKGRL
jgi:cytochrome P450